MTTAVVVLLSTFYFHSSTLPLSRAAPPPSITPRNRPSSFANPPIARRKIDGTDVFRIVGGASVPGPEDGTLFSTVGAARELRWLTLNNQSPINADRRDESPPRTLSRTRDP